MRAEEIYPGAVILGGVVLERPLTEEQQATADAIKFQEMVWEITEGPEHDC